MDNGQQPVGSTPTPDAPAAGAPTPTSTPNLPAPDNNSAHPFFANHPTQTFNNDAGDIILNNGPKPAKNNKLKFLLIILIAVLAIIAVAAGVWNVVGGNNKASLADVRQAFSNYYDYVKNGPEGTDAEDDEWFLIGLADHLYFPEQEIEYTEQAKDLYTNFKSQVLQSVYRQNADLLNEIELNESYLEAICDFISIRNTSNELLYAYVDGGQSAATQYIDQYSSTRLDETSIVKDFLDKIKQYLVYQLSIYVIYSESSCLIGSAIDYVCAKELALNEEYPQLTSDANTMTLQLTIKYHHITSIYKDNMNSIKESLDV